jgi:hypothetical protein
MKAHTLGRLIVTTCNQPGNAPFVDRARTIEREEWGSREWKSVAILLTPWRKDEHGQHRPQRALVLGWQI